MFPACYASSRGYDCGVPETVDNTEDWPGRSYGLPASGPRSMARLGRRVIAIAIDWGIAYGIGAAFFDSDNLAIIVAFAILQVLPMIVFSGSIGHLILGLRVVPLQPRWIGLWRPVVRTLLLCLVIPAFIWDKEQRGLHDVLAGTILVRR